MQFSVITYLFLYPLTTLKRPSTIQFCMWLNLSDHLYFWCFSCRHSSWNPPTSCSKLESLCSGPVAQTLSWNLSSLSFWKLFFSQAGIPFPGSSVLLFLFLILFWSISANSSLNKSKYLRSHTSENIYFKFSFD